MPAAPLRQDKVPLGNRKAWLETDQNAGCCHPQTGARPRLNLGLLGGRLTHAALGSIGVALGGSRNAAAAQAVQAARKRCATRCAWSGARKTPSGVWGWEMRRSTHGLQSVP